MNLSSIRRTRRIALRHQVTVRALALLSAALVPFAAINTDDTFARDSFISQALSALDAE